MSRLGFDQVGKVYGDGTHAITDFNLEVGDGEFVVFVGPSGCGKSTALRMVAGLEPVTHGRISVGERVVNHIPPKDRDIAMVFQTYALYPHMTIAENMGFALKMSKVPKSEIERRVKQAGELLGISEHLDRRPRHLSGGQRQRAAMGRAIVRDPQAFLMDEPLSNLDAKLRMQMRAEISELQGRLGVTTLYVTHDQIEAMTMGDRVAVLKLGVLQQAGKPQDLFSSPANLFVASFIGSPAMNLLEADVLRQDGGLAVRFGSLTLGVGDASAEKCPSLEEYVGKRVVVGLRPDYFFRPDASVPDRQRLTTRVSLVEPLGTEVLAHLDTDARKVLTEATDPTGDGEAADERDREELTRNAKLTTKFPTQDAPDSGAHCEIAYDIERMYFFDPDSGEAL